MSYYVISTFVHCRSAELERCLRITSRRRTGHWKVAASVKPNRAGKTDRHVGLRPRHTRDNNSLFLSSRFTDSDKYEDEFENCFLLESEERTGDICNACVLIVKRWRQLPVGTSKNWAHVVDARAGPGHNTKKMMVPVVLKPSVKKRPIEEVEEERSPKILRKMKKKKLMTKVEARVAKIERTRARRKNPEGVRRRLVGEQRSINNCTSGFIDFGYWRR